MHYKATFSFWILSYFLPFWPHLRNYPDYPNNSHILCFHECNTYIHVNFWFKQITTLVPNLFIRVVFEFSDCLDLTSYVLQLKMFLLIFIYESSFFHNIHKELKVSLCLHSFISAHFISIYHIFSVTIHREKEIQSCRVHRLLEFTHQSRPIYYTHWQF